MYLMTTLRATEVMGPWVAKYWVVFLCPPVA